MAAAAVLKLRILHVVPTFWPAIYWGGPIFSTRAICDGISSRQGFEVRVLTTDSAGPRVSERVEPGSVKDDGYLVRRCRRIAGTSVSPGLLYRLPLEIMKADLVHLTSTYSFPTLPTLALARFLGKPVVWSPRGALQATADWENAPRRQAKVRFERLAQRLRPGHTVLHVTSVEEAERSIANLRDIRTELIPNSVEIPSSLPRRDWRPQGTLRLLFLGRLHPKKGLDLLMEAMTRLPDWVRLTIHGDGDPAYVEGLRNRAATDSRIKIPGPIDSAGKTAAFAEADLFILPSWSENFGIAVAEALAHGVPVITTDRTPWRDLEARKCGLCIAPAEAEIVHSVLGLADADLQAMGAIGRDWMAQEFSASAMSDAFERLYLRMATLSEDAKHR